jgi:crotonobetainyl-CoA:carnitine CoA-transferase CaiB-like acyl-CoA transferase
LSGLRVLDLSRVLSGPICGRILADMGAEVIKIESPDGDLMRGMRPATNGISHVYAHLNAGKRSVCVDLKHPDGAEVVTRLAERGDVLIENFRPGVAQRLGLGSRSLLDRNPRLIYCSISGWGQDGPWSKKPAYAPMVHAEMGNLSLAAELHGSSIRQEVHHHADTYAGLMASNAILAALVERACSGEGRSLDITMAEVMLYVNEYASTADDTGPPMIDSFTFESFGLADGTLVTLIGNPRQMLARWAEALGAPALAEDPRFRTAEDIGRNLDAAVAAIQDLMQRVPDATALGRILEPQGLLHAVVRSLDAALETQWSHARGAMAEVAPGIRIPRTPWRRLGQQPEAPTAPGSLGADNEIVLQEWLELDRREITSLAERGVLHAAPPTPPAGEKA